MMSLYQIMAVQALAAVMLAGCGVEFRPESATNRGVVAPGGVVMPGDDSAKPARTVQPTVSATPPATTPSTSIAQDPAQAQPAGNPPTPVQVPAQVGVGKKGRDYGGGIVSEPIRAKFRAEQRIVFDQVKAALNLYKATNGSAPKTHEEFMKEVIQGNQIQLPELPSGESYMYDPQTEELMVQK